MEILLIEDDDFDRQNIKRILKKANIQCHVTECINPEEVKETLAFKEFDCIFLDYLLPGIDGLELLKELRFDGLKTPVVVFTSQGNESIAVEMMKSGAIDYVVKTELNEIKVFKLLQRVQHINEIEKQKIEAQTALRLSEARLKEAQRIAKIGSWEVDLKTQKVYWSNELFMIHDKDPMEFNPPFDGFDDIFDENEHLNLAEAFQELMTKGSMNIDTSATMKDGSIKYLNIQGFVQYDALGNPEKIIGATQDITTRKLFEQELKEAKVEAESFGKVKEQFLANMSHEIRTPLNAIIGFTRILIKNQNNLTSEQKRQIKNIYTAGENLLLLVNDILDISKIESGKLKLEKSEFNLVDLTKDVLQLFNSRAKEKGLLLSIKYVNEINSTILGDTVRLNQILTNLISNAIKFTVKGSVTVSVSKIKETDQSILIRFEVSDTGIGIPEDKFGSIFEAFTQANHDTTRKFGGTGLGLTIVRRLVALYQGKIDIRSKTGEGTTFIVDIPFEKYKMISESELVSSDESMTDDRKIYPENLKVLMAEDNEMNQELARFIFDDIGWDLDIAENGKIAVEMLIEGDYDIVLMDIQMPEMDGYEATKVIREELPAPFCHIPIIAITAHAFNNEVQRCLAAGMNDYLSKPFAVQDLVSKVGAVIIDKSQSVKAVDEATHTLNDEPINLENLYAISGNNRSTVVNIIKLFVNQTPDRLEKLQALIKEQNWDEVIKLSHKMKSSYAIIGAEKVRKMLDQIENWCKSDSFDEKEVVMTIDAVQKLHNKLMVVLLSELEK